MKLNQELPLEIDFEAARVSEPNREKLFEMFQEFGFKRFADEMRTTPETQVEQSWEVIDTSQKFESWFKKLKSRRNFASISKQLL
ncbi:MAG: hypothetical protein R3C11_08025 [Planctomycetaceae bacterium]